MPAKLFRSALALVLLFVMPHASAVRLNPRGIGQVLIYPYYTVNKSQDTLISVTNASDVSKAVQVRFREGYDGRDVLAFVLFLSPHDVWTASISQTGDAGGAALRTSDASCTSPAIPAGGIAFSSAGYDGTGTLPGDGGPDGITRTREGLIELIVGADVTPGSPTDVAITHVQNGHPGGGVPPGCATLSNPIADEVAPTGGVFGSGTIVNVGQGTFFPYNADAIQGFTSTVLFGPTTSATGLTLGQANSSEAVAGVATAYITNADGQPIALDFAFGVDAVSAVFMADAIENEYVVAASLGANTDWVVSFPTKSFYVDPQYPGVPLAPFEFAYSSGHSDVEIAGTVYDREQAATDFGGPCQICPPPLPPPALLYEVNVIPLQTAAETVSGVFGSNLGGISIAPRGDAGHVFLDLSGAGVHVLPGGIDANGVGVTLQGLPVTGFMAYNVINANAQPGLLANYSGAFPYRRTVSCQTGSGTCVPTINEATAQSGGSTARFGIDGEGQ